MTWRRTSLRASVALTAIAVPLACAQGEPEKPGASPDQDASLLDAATAEASIAPGIDAGDCSASDLCRVVAPIESFIGLTSVWGSSASDVWSVGTRGTILHYDGVAWEKAEHPDGEVAYTMRSVWLERPDDVWIVDGRRIRHSKGWGGPTSTEWQFFDYSSFEPDPVAIRGRANGAWLARASFQYQDDGTPLPMNGEPLVKFDGWADDGPTNPRMFGPSYGYIATAITMPRPDEVWSVGDSRVLRATLEDAAADVWTVEEHDSRSVDHLYGIWGDESVVWTVGEVGTLRRMTRSAVPDKTFEVIEGPTTADLRGVFGFGANDVWAVGESGTVLHWDGTSWTKLSTPFDGWPEKPTMRAVWGSSANDVWIVGDGEVLHFAGKSR